VSRQVWLIRHAETEWSKASRHTGRTDLQLTEAGEAVARALAPRLAEHSFGRVLVSPLQRARRTAELAGVLGGADLRDDLMEWDYGFAEGRTTAEIREERPGWTVWDGPIDDGEDVDAVGERADRVIAEVLAADGDVLLVAHGHVLRVLAARWLEQPAAFGGRLRLEPASVSVLGFERERRVLVRWGA
jgi:broad specificity phosphatase PhoE